MALTLRHWVAATLVGCAALAVGFLPPPIELPPSSQSVPTPDRGARGQIARALRRDYETALYLRRRDEALALVRRSPAGTQPVVLVDPRRPKAVTTSRVGLVTSSVDSAARRLAPLDPSVRIALVLTRDTDFAAPGVGGLVRLRRPLYFLPEGTDGRTCLVLVSKFEIAPAPSVLGPCAFYAAFGRPGAGVTRWLQATAYYTATEPDWVRPRPAQRRGFYDISNYQGWIWAVAANAYQGLGLTGGACAARRLERCRELLDTLPWFMRGHRHGVLATITEKPFWRDDEPEWYLADLVRHMGRDRFAKFWRSSLPRDSAFAAAYGMPIEEWTHRWLAEQRPNVRVGPGIRIMSTVLGLLFAGVLVAAGAVYASRRRVA